MGWLINDNRSQSAVAVTTSEAAADFVVMTLNVNNIQANVVAYVGVYPSVDWVQGYRIEVSAGQVEATRDLLRDLAIDREGLVFLDAAEAEAFEATT